jgi:hypothetical protein
MDDLGREDRGMTDAREQVAAAMMRCSLATGHGNTLESLLAEMEWQVNRLQNQIAQHLSGCQLRGPGECQKEGKCTSASCVNYSKETR